MYLKVGGVHSPALDIGAEGEGGKVLEGISGHLGKLGHLPTFQPSNLPTFQPLGRSVRQGDQRVED